MKTTRGWRGGANGRGGRRDNRRRPGVEPLEGRALLAAIAIDAGQVVRPVAPNLLGVNLAWWDSSLNTPQTAQMVQAAGLDFFRFPGGSSSDDFHFNNPASYNGQGTDSSMASFVASVKGQAVVTLDYGSGSPQEAAAFLAYFNGSVGNTTAIGQGQEWNDSANAYQAVDWKTAGYWAGPPRGDPAGDRRRAQLPPPRPRRPVRLPLLRGRQRGVRELGGRPPRQPARPGDVCGLCQAVRHPRRRDRPDDLDRDRRRQPLREQQLGRRRARAIGLAGVRARVHQRPQLRPGARRRVRLEPAPEHRLEPQQPRRQQPVRLGRPGGRLPAAADAVPRVGRQGGRAARHGVQLGLLQPRQADDQPGQRPVRGRLARQSS